MTHSDQSKLESLQDQLKANLTNIQQRIASTCVAHKQTQQPLLLAVSKKQSIEKILKLYELGLHNFGESYLQEALTKMDAFKQQDWKNDICWHFIGPIQSNKTRPIAEHFDWVHSIDSLKIASRLNQQRPEQLPPLNVCLQINIDDEPSKRGIKPQAAAAIAAEISKMERLKLRGLMCIPKPQSDASASQQSFMKTRQLREQLEQMTGLALDTLSMGMSSDLEWAIAEGSTIVRIGSALLGERSA